jgi:hypothetical protein
VGADEFSDEGFLLGCESVFVHAYILPSDRVDARARTAKMTKKCILRKKSYFYKKALDRESPITQSPITQSLMSESDERV